MKKQSGKAIDWILAVLAVLALGFGGFMVYRFSSFPAAERQAEIDDAKAMTLSVQEEKTALEENWTAAQDAVLEDLSDLGQKGVTLQNDIETAKAENAEKTEDLEKLNDKIELSSDAYNNMLSFRKEYALKIRELEDLINAGESEAKICYWTMDDGPSYHTMSFLNYAEEAGIYLTFFTSHDANNSKDEVSELRAEAMGGHSICNHTYSHQYADMGNVYGKGLDSFKDQIKQQEDWVKECTGLTTDIFRYPGGKSWAMARLPEGDSALEELGYKEIDWSCNAYDSGLPENLPDGDSEANNIVFQVKTMPIAVLLTHDWNTNTLYAMQKAVPQLQKAGYLFLPLFSDSWVFGNTEIIFK